MSSGTATYTASAPGYASATANVTLTRSGFVIEGPFGLGATFFTTPGAENSDLTIYSARLDANGNYVAQQLLRGGISASVDVTSSTTSVGTISISPVAISGGTGSGATQFAPLANGSTVISTSVPAGFSAPSQFGSLTATVSTPNLVLFPTVATVGKNLQQIGTVLLGQVAGPGGVEVTLTSNSGQLLLSSTGTQTGALSITLTVPAGQTSATYFMQALVDSGAATYTATAPGFAPKTATVNMARSGVVLSGPFGFGFDLSTPLSGGNQPVTVWTALLNASDAFVQQQQLAGGLSLEVFLRSSDPAVGSITPSVTISGGSDSSVAQFTPVGVGDTTVSMLPVAGYTLPSNYTTVLARVTN
jgi:hypothetical protein